MSIQTQIHPSERSKNMSHSLTVCAIAYRKGVDEQRSRGRKNKCPYGLTKIELQHWWLAGFNDSKNKTVDDVMYQTGSKHK